MSLKYLSASVTEIKLSFCIGSVSSPFSVMNTGGFPYLSFMYRVSFRMPQGTMCNQLEAAYRQERIHVLLVDQFCDS